MRRILSEPSQPELLYELSSFVQHYGNAVDHGHYVAHIKDENTGQWWRFNDKIVTKDSQSSLTKTFSSEDVYLMMYRVKDTNHIERDDNICVPSHYFEEIQTSNATYQKKYNQRKEKESSLINERTEEVRSVLSEASVQSLSQPFFWISCDWLRQWAKNVTPSAIDNTAITCSHGKVLVSKVTSMKRLSSKAWETLLEKYGGGPKLSHEDCCLDCLKEGAQNVMSADTYRDRRESFKQLAWDILDGKNEDGKYYVSRSCLFMWKCVKLNLNSSYFLVPTSWISKWRNYINPDVKNSDTPETLNVAINSLLCEKHARLIERPPELILSFGVLTLRESSACGLTLITEEDWKCFCKEWDTEIQGVSAEFENMDNMNNEFGNCQVLIKTCPEVCESCIGEKESHKFHYCNEDICVIFVRGKGRREHSSKAEFNSSTNLEVSASTSLYTLKMLIWDYFGVVKENQILEKGGITIDNSDEYTTLVDLNIFAGDQIIVRDSDDELVNEKKDTQYTEEGYRGTLLTSNVSSQGRTSMQKPPNHFNVQDLSPREVLESIDQFFVEGHISQYPEFAVPSLTDHIYLKEVGHIVLLKRFMISPSSRGTKSLIHWMLHKIRSNLRANRSTTLRALYYMNTFFTSESQSTTIVDYIAAMLECTRTSLNIYAVPTGYVIGDLTFVYKNEIVDCRRVEKPIPTGVITDLRTEADYILLVEKDCILARLSDDDFHISHKCIIISSHGRPSMAVRGLVRSLKLRFQLPIFALMDFDPAGIDIMVSFEYGSKNSALYNSNLITKGIKWLGVKQGDIQLLPDGCMLEMTEKNLKAAKEMLRQPQIRENSEWVKSLMWMIKNKKKTRIDALTADNISYLANTYLPSRISEMMNEFGE
ncbi:ubiquitin carboxyl-terminal hydrolase 26-like isoform X3 [Trifolium pratense]|uniref:ubiquitin carboxyl-terminal hydrolase 26-like isoform X3 n=1 Tax=Trifolium pratense TaxID=57577 RepID=UPI001E691D13|nr:ubiquitin carboxyl-terminal hydrolase 26-like isoform X3 [Trifolium pratense]